MGTVTIPKLASINLIIFNVALLRSGSVRMRRVTMRLFRPRLEQQIRKACCEHSGLAVTFTFIHYFVTMEYFNNPLSQSKKIFFNFTMDVDLAVRKADAFVAWYAISCCCPFNHSRSATHVLVILNHLHVHVFKR